MLNNIYLGGLQDIASSFTVTAQNTPAAQANMLLAKPISMISLLVTVAGVFFMYFIPALFIVKGLLSCVPVVNNWVNENGGGGSGQGVSGYLSDNWVEFIVGFLFAINAASGLWASECGLIASGSAAVIQKIINASWDTTDNPASIKQFTDNVKVYSGPQDASMYETYLKTETNMKQQLTSYVQAHSPSANDQTYNRLRASYTAVVARLMILSQQLDSLNYAKDAGVSNDFFQRHLVPDQSTSNDDGAYNKAFINASMIQSFTGVDGHQLGVPGPRTNLSLGGN